MRKHASAATHDALLEDLLGDRAYLLRIAQSVVGCRIRAEDVVQDVAVKLCQGAAGGDLKTPLHYLRRMVRNEAIDSLRRMTVEARPAAADDAVETLVAPCACPQARMEACEALRAVAGALAELPERTRCAFVAHRLKGEPQNAIAARLHVSPTLVNFMMRDATAWCRRALDEADGRSAA